MNRLFILISFLFSSLLLTACGNSQTDQASTADIWHMGTLPAQTDQLIQQEWEIYRKKHPDVPEDQARRDFDIIQVMSRENYDPYIAKWAERRALANTWIEQKIEKVFSPEAVPREFVQAAIDAYAFNSGHPALVTASHILIHPSDSTTPEQRIKALSAVRADLLAHKDFSNEALRIQAQRLIRAGFRVDMNDDLTFPRQYIKPFMNETPKYQAVVEPFANAAFALTEDNPLSDIVESEFGHHLILFRSRTEEVKASITADYDFMVSNIVQQGRKLAFNQFVEELVQKATPNTIVNEVKVAEMASIR